MTNGHSSYDDLARERRDSQDYRDGYAEAQRAFLIGQTVRERRLTLGLSQTELAARAGMTQPALSRLEAGGVIPTIPLLERISAALDADLIVQISLHVAGPVPLVHAVDAAADSSDGWTSARRRLHEQLAERSSLLADYYASAIYFLSAPGAPARMSQLAHAIRELCGHLPDAVGVVRIDRSQSESASAAFVKAWQAAGLPDDAQDFADVPGDDSDAAMCLLPRSVAEAGAAVIAAQHVRGNNIRRAALMIADPHAPGARSAAERDPTVRRWSKIVDGTFFPFVHAFDKSPPLVSEDDLQQDFAFLEEVIRGVLAPLEHVADLDDLLAETQRTPAPPTSQDSQDAAGTRLQPVPAGTTEHLPADGNGELVARWPEPSAAQIHRLQNLTSHRARFAYFFGRLENPRWLGPLAEAGWLDPDRVPEPIAEAAGTVRIDIWPLSGYLSRVAAAVPDTAAAAIRRLAGTANSIVHRDFTAALLCLSPASAAGFIRDVIAWIRGPYARWLDERDLSQLAVNLLDGGQQEAGRRLAGVILVALQESYWLRESIATLTDSLQRVGTDGVLVLADALDRVIGSDSSAEMANFGRSAIADHEQDDHIDATDHLIDGLRDCTLAYLRRTRDTALLTTLLHRRATLHTRIVYYVTATVLSEPDAAAGAEELRSYARTLVMDETAFADSRTRLEHGALIKAMLAHLSSDDLAQLAGWIRRGPQISDDEIRKMLGIEDASDATDKPEAAARVEGFKDHWRADRIALLGPDLPEPLHGIAADLTARKVRPPEHPGFSHWITNGPTPESPLSATELASMSVAEVTEFVRGYRPSAHHLFRFPEYALTQQITEDISARPAAYSQHAAAFADLQPGHVQALLNGLQQAIGAHARNPQDQGAPPMGLAWGPVLDLAASLAGTPDPGGRGGEQPENSPRWLHLSTAMLLKTALTVPTSGLLAEHADAILGILSTLLNSPDPVLDDEAEDDNLDPAERALNSVRGQATSCLVAFTGWWHRLGRIEADAAQPLLELLSARLDPSQEASTAVRTVYGQFFPKLFSLLPNWTRSHLEAIFGSPPIEPETRERDPVDQPEPTPAERLGQAAFDAYLLANGPGDGTLFDVLRPYYEREATLLRETPRAWRLSLRNTRQVLLDHLLLFIVWGALAKDDPLTARAIRRAGVAETSAAVGHLGWLIFRAGDTEPAFRQQAQGLWDWWRGRAQMRAGNGDREAAAVMVASFPWWWRASDLDITWQFRELSQVLAIAPAVETPGLVVSTLAERSEGHESDAMSALEVILDSTTDRTQLQDTVTKAQPALHHLLTTADTGIRRRATALVQKIAGWGMVELARNITQATT